MKIIRKGQSNWQLKPTRFHCRRCQCTFEADNTEYIRSDIVDEYGDSAFQYQINCPNCNLPITKIERGNWYDDKDN